MSEPTWKMIGTGIKPASPLSWVGIPKFWISQEPIAGPNTIGMAIQKIIRIPRNFPRLSSGSKSLSQATDAILVATAKACQTKPDKASKGSVRTRESKMPPILLSTRPKAIIGCLCHRSANMPKGIARIAEPTITAPPMMLNSDLLTPTKFSR